MDLNTWFQDQTYSPTGCAKDASGGILEHLRDFGSISIPPVGSGILTTADPTPFGNSHLRVRTLRERTIALPINKGMLEWHFLKLRVRYLKDGFKKEAKKDV